MKTISLSQGKFALVDDADFDWLSQWKWCTTEHCDTYYAVRCIWRNGKCKTISMHREIIKTPSGMETDHKDGNGLNNCRDNLRIATSFQNHANRRKIRSASSKYKGVSWDKSSLKWRSRIFVHQKEIYLGSFDSEENAAYVYDKSAQKYFGEFALTNKTRMK